jgi:hypothetical protein
VTRSVKTKVKKQAAARANSWSRIRSVYRKLSGK